jgi:altronate dehydratase
MKGGTTPIEGILEYGEAIDRKGLHIMQGPGNDLESVTGLAASGVNLICFSTGRGTVTGSAIVPVIKISSTTDLFRRLPEDIDFDAGPLLEAEDQSRATEELGAALLERMIAVASGERSHSEINRQRQFQIWTAGKLSL